MATPRAAQTGTLKLFQAAKAGYTIRELADELKITTSSARSRIVRCYDNEWLSYKDEQGPTGVQHRYAICAEGKKVLKRALKRK